MLLKGKKILIILSEVFNIWENLLFCLAKLERKLNWCCLELVEDLEEIKKKVDGPIQEELDLLLCH